MLDALLDLIKDDPKAEARSIDWLTGEADVRAGACRGDDRASGEAVEAARLLLRLRPIPGTSGFGGHQLVLADADWASASDCLPPVAFAR